MLVLLIGIFRSSHDNAFRWMSESFTEDKSTLVQVMAWCHQATRHYMKQYWPRSVSSYGITRPQWINHTWYKRVLKPSFSFPAYRLYTVVPRLVKFVDQLTNWYVRMNRRRLKGETGVKDCRKALETLYGVLFTMTKVMVSLWGASVNSLNPWRFKCAILNL